MRGKFVIAVAMSGVATLAAAQTQPVTALPDGWTLNGDGSFAHAQSGVVCTKTVGSYNFVRLDGASGPGILGTCIYSGGDMRVGEIRVRKFVDGTGDTPLAIQNDRVLMGVEPMSNAPPGAKILSAHRMGPGPDIDGQQTSQAVLTSVRNGLLVDCISQTKRDAAEGSYGFQNFLKACAFSDH